MSNRGPSKVLQQLTQLAKPGIAGLTDCELLARFCRDRDQAAFELIVWRHGGLVLGACRRLLGSAADAEDAFQATFLALARRAQALNHGEALPSWLYRVAVRAALRLRSETRRRNAQPLPEIADPSTIPDAETALVLDQEIARLPEKLRLAFVLCVLQGRSDTEAAAQLGCPKGTIASRLARAKERLRVRLTRRGVAPAILTVVVPAVEVRASLMSETIRVCVERGSASAVASTRVATLASQVLWAQTVAAWKPTFATIAASLLVAAGGLALLPLAPSPELRAESPRPLEAEPKPMTPEQPPKTDEAQPLPPWAIQRIGHNLFLHPQPVSHVLFAEKDAEVATLGGGLLQWWDASTGAAKGNPLKLTESTTAAELPPKLSADQSTLLQVLPTGGKGSILAAFDTTTGKIRHSINVSDNAGLNQLQISHNGRWAVGQHEKSIVVWDFAGQKKANQFEVPGGFPHAVSSDGKLVALTIQFGIAEIRSVDQGKVLWEFSNDFPKVLGQKQPHELLSSMAFSPDGKTLATVGSWAVPGAPFPAPVRLWDIAEKKHVWSQLQPENPGYIGQQLKFSPKGEFVSLLWTTLMLLDAKTGKIAHEYPTSTGDGLNYAVSPDGKRLARAAGRRLRLWTLADHKEPVALVGPKSPAQLIARSPDGKFIATGNGGKEVWIWNSSENSPNAVRTASARAIEIGFSPDSKFLLTISRGDSPPVRIWSTKSNKLFSQFGWSAAVSHRAAFGRHGLFTVLDHVPGLYDAVTEKAIWTGKAITSFGNNDPLVVISPLAEYYATDTGVYSVATGNQVSQANPGFPLAVSDDGKRIIYRNKEGQIGLHTTTSISQPKPIAVGSVFAFSPQRDRMAMVSGLALKVIDLNTGKAVCECERPAAIDPETWKKWWARNVQFSPDGKRLVAQGETNGLGVWDAETGISLAWFAPLDSLPLATYSFSDPQTITAAYGQGDQIIVWSLNAKPK